MPNTNFVPNWTFERTLPSPFDSYSGKSAVMKDIASKYCNQPKKRATLHSATLQAVFSYMNLENPPAGKAEEELGAIGSQANNFTIAEYPSRTGLLHVVVYNRMTGKFIAGKYEKPLDLDSKPEPYQFKKDEDSGSALYFALMPTFLSDDEFNEKYQELKQHRDDGFPDLPKAAETAAVLCDNVYRRIRYGDSLPIGNIKVDTPANGVLQRLTPLNIQKGVYAPTEIIQGTFQVLKGGHHYTASAVSIPKEDFVDKYILSNSRTLTPQEESTVPILEDWYVIPKEIQRICEHAKLTTDSKQPMRNFMLRGPAGTGKTEGAKAIAAGLHLSDCMDYIDDALIATQGKERLRASNYLLVLCWNYIQPMVELTRESLKKQDSTQVGDALEDLLRKESGSGSPLPTGKNGGIPKNIPGPTVKSKTPITCDLSGLDPNYRQDAINQAEKVLQEEGGRIELAKTTAVLDGNNPGITYASQYAGSGYENAANDLARILNDVATEKAQNDYEQELTEDLQKSADEIHYGNAHAGIHVTIHRINPVSDFFIKSYQTVASPLLRTSKRLQSSILPLLKEEAEGGKQKNLLFGKRLDMRALHRKDGGIFTRTRLPDEEQKLSVGLLVDESGSMGWGDRITHARKTAIVLYDFCMSLGIPITIYGHSTDSKGVALYSYAEFDSLDASDRYRLMDMSARNGNRDGAALRYVAEHLAKRPESQKLLIIISDGQPADCGYSGTEAEADLRGIKNEYRKRGIVIFAAAIGDDKENIRRIYQDGFLDITKLEDLPKNMTQLVKQYLK